MMRLLLPFVLAGGVLAQNASNATPTSFMYNGSAVEGPAPGALVTNMQLSVDDLWDMFVGPVVKAKTTTTVQPTPIPSESLIPPPSVGNFPFPGRQVPLVPKNESWKFPKDFIFGVAGAAFQIEGAARDEGKGPSNYDVNTHRVLNFVVDNSTGDTTDNNYYMYKQDIARLAAIGIKSYSFSIAWTRILPFGTGPVNELGIAHYNDVVNTCIEYGITPMITLYHWDTPALLQNKYGGWLGEDIIHDFTEYARILYSAYGDRVKHWFTINEPIVVCTQQYPQPLHYWRNVSIPTKQQTFVCGRNILLSHASAYRLGKQMMPDSIIAFKNNGGHKIPLTDSPEDAEATQRAWDFAEGWFADPVYKNGDWPKSLGDYVSAFMPPFTQAQKDMILGSGDLFAHDAYSASFYMAPDSGIAACVANTSNPLYPSCANSTNFYPPSLGGWVIGASADPRSPWLHKATDWLPSLLRHFNHTWPCAGGIAITEFGFAEPFESSKVVLEDILYDVVRASYFRDYMEAVLMSMAEGINVVGTLAWSFVDNFEWAQGFESRFGMQFVNFTDPGLERRFKASFFEYVGVYKMYVEE